ncbi:hypothetical protein OPV22_000232 [Ensete ventricosum]|uniref:Uncharacterized protein n=1 Tax=Ensete ventricosum TaxID=4639 RepID=A0AAV8RSV5_ENSVE|nr:hypothetical protein OPV22_000232 [Ensete ventricosum]
MPSRCCEPFDAPLGTVQRRQMVGIFALFSAGRASHRRTKSAADVRQVLLAPNMDAGGSSTGTDHEADVNDEFKPIEHPTEPLDHDQPVRCPLPDPSILDDGGTWKGRISSASAGSAGLPVVKQDTDVEPEAGGTTARSVSTGVPEHRFVTVLEEDCNADETQIADG